MSDQASRTDERLAAAKQVTGAAHVSRVNIDLHTLLELGLLVDVSFHGEARFQGRATWAELGIPQGDVRQERLTPGAKYLLPRAYIRRVRSLATRFRQSLDKYTFTLEGFRPYKWLPFTAYEEWQAEWHDLQALLETLRQEIVDHRDEFVDMIAEEWAEIAAEAWEAIAARRDEGNGFAVITPYGAFDTLATFTDHVVNRATARFPTVKEIETCLYADYRTAVLITGADVEEEGARRDVAHAQRQAEWAEVRTLEAQERATRQQMELDERAASDQARHREEEHRTKLEAMRQAELEHAREQLARMRSPLEEVFSQFRARIYKDVQDITASIRRNGSVRGKVAQRAGSLLDVYRLLGSATGDEALENALQTLRTVLAQRPADKAAGQYNTAAVEAALQEVADLTHEQAEEVAAWAAGRTRAGGLEM